MSSNYPPGVTGNEPEIAGYPTSASIRECQAEAATLTRYSVLDVVRSVDLSDPSRARDLLKAAIDALPTDEDGVCMYEGPVEVEHVGDIDFWECPNCGAEHEDEADGPDPDEQRDRMMEERWAE